MKNKADPPDDHRKNNRYAFTPLITTIVFPLLIGRQKNVKSIQEKSVENNKPKSKGLAITKFEVSDDKSSNSMQKAYPKNVGS